MEETEIDGTTREIGAQEISEIKESEFTEEETAKARDKETVEASSYETIGSGGAHCFGKKRVFQEGKRDRKYPVRDAVRAVFSAGPAGPDPDVPDRLCTFQKEVPAKARNPDFSDDSHVVFGRAGLGLYGQYADLSSAEYLSGTNPARSLLHMVYYDSSQLFSDCAIGFPDRSGNARRRLVFTAGALYNTAHASSHHRHDLYPSARQHSGIRFRSLLPGSDELQFPADGDSDTGRICIQGIDAAGELQLFSCSLCILFQSSPDRYPAKALSFQITEVFGQCRTVVIGLWLVREEMGSDAGTVTDRDISSRSADGNLLLTNPS